MTTVTCNPDVVFRHTVGGISTGTRYATDRSSTQDRVTMTAPDGCMCWIGASTTATFTETVKTVGGISYQDVVIDGSDLRVGDPVSGCSSPIDAGNAIPLNATTNLQVNGSHFRAIVIVP